MKHINSNVFGKVCLPNTFEELFCLTKMKPQTEFSRVRMWRGQASISWPIHSGAYRKLLSKGEYPTEKSMIFYERELLKRATHRGLRDIEGKRLSDFELLARLQHHGAATRLVDASRNALVALYFACRDLPDETGALLGLHSSFLGGYETQPLDIDYDTEVSAIAKFQHPQTWEPSSVSPRIAAQHSQFLFSAVSQQKTGSLWIDDDKDALLVIGLTPDFKQAAIEILRDVFDIRYFTLFPDLDGFCEAHSQLISEDIYRW